ncbi:hypothetical protein DFJ74DRAFT_764241 [Hyaloraphidium curvatum]|nr:hypothetical protein DFJ74DRAFT_764241 [Hyaloraphidium curvatum]
MGPRGAADPESSEDSEEEEPRRPRGKSSGRRWTAVGGLAAEDRRRVDAALDGAPVGSLPQVRSLPIGSLEVYRADRRHIVPHLLRRPPASGDRDFLSGCCRCVIERTVSTNDPGWAKRHKGDVCPADGPRAPGRKRPRTASPSPAPEPAAPAPAAPPALRPRPPPFQPPSTSLYRPPGPAAHARPRPSPAPRPAFTVGRPVPVPFPAPGPAPRPANAGRPPAAPRFLPPPEPAAQADPASARARIADLEAQLAEPRAQAGIPPPSAWVSDGWAPQGWEDWESLPVGELRHAFRGILQENWELKTLADVLLELYWHTAGPDSGIPVEDQQSETAADHHSETLADPPSENPTDVSTAVLHPPSPAPDPLLDPVPLATVSDISRGRSRPPRGPPPRTTASWPSAAADGGAEVWRRLEEIVRAGHPATSSSSGPPAADPVPGRSSPSAFAEPDDPTSPRALPHASLQGDYGRVLEAKRELESQLRAKDKEIDRLRAKLREYESAELPLPARDPADHLRGDAFMPPPGQSSTGASISSLIDYSRELPSPIGPHPPEQTPTAASTSSSSDATLPPFAGPPIGSLSKANEASLPPLASILLPDPSAV